MRINSKYLKIPYLYVFIVFCLTFSAVKYWPLIGITSICYAIGIALPILICRTFFNTPSFQCFIAYGLVVLLNFFAGDDYFSNANSLMIGFIGFYVSLSMSYYVFQNKDYDLLKKIVFTLLIVLLWTTVATAYFDISSPGLVRYAYGVVLRGDSEETMFNPMLALGLSSYALPHCLPVLIPPFVMGLRNKSLAKMQRALAVLALACCLMLVYFSGASGPLLVSFVIVLISFIVRKGSVSSNIAIFVLALLIVAPFLFNEELLLGVLDWFDGLVGVESYFHKKIGDIQDSIVYGDSSGDVEARGDLYSMTIAAILENPIIGVQEGMGKHSALLDRFASLGLVGFIPLICLLVLQTKYTLRKLPSQIHIYYYVGLLAAFMMLISKNITGWGMWFFLFAAMPFLLVYYSNASELNSFVNKIRHGKSK